MSTHTTVTIIGAGQAGLAMSRCLTDRGIDHVVLERGRIAERWQSERWDSLKLLTPNWMSRLPGQAYDGPNPEGFMTMPEITRYLTDYAASFNAPVQDETTVFRARRTEIGPGTRPGYVLDTNQGVVNSRGLVIATGASATPAIPEIAGAVPAHVHQTTPKHYKHPGGLPEGRVLVVGASASGVQLAREINASGRPVTLAVGSHTRMPRTYRGFDIQLWLDMMGTLERSYDTIDDIAVARRAPSLQLVGGDHGETLDLNTLRSEGVELAGRLNGVADGRITFADDLAQTCREGDDALLRMLVRMDRWAVLHGIDRSIDPPSRPDRIDTRNAVPSVDVGAGGISTILWATGYRPDNSYLDMDVVTASGEIAHDGGVVTGAPGMYLMGLPLLRTRKSTYIDGVGADADALSNHLTASLARPALSAAAA